LPSRRTTSMTSDCPGPSNLKSTKQGDLT
jgi:hypothetical protein